MNDTKHARGSREWYLATKEAEGIASPTEGILEMFFPDPDTPLYTEEDSDGNVTVYPMARLWSTEEGDLPPQEPKAAWSFTVKVI